MRHSIFAAGAVLLSLALPAEACWSDNSTWESRVANADLIGVLECTVAGVGVARYKVVEAWGGTKQVGHELTIGWGGQHLVGERLLVVSSRPATGLVSPASGLSHGRSLSTTGKLLPLGARRLRVDRTFLFDAVRLPVRPGYALERLRSPHKTVAAFKRAAQALLTLSTEERELRVLRSLTQRHAKRLGPNALTDVAAATTVAQVVRALVGTKKTRWILSIGGGARTLAALPNTAAAKTIAKSIRTTLGLVPPRAFPVRAGGLASKRGLQNFLSNEYGLLEARRLNPTASDAVTRVSEFEAGDPGEPYWLASHLCAVLPEQRQKHLIDLLGAKNPWVRVAGAVYLTYEDEQQGRAALQRLTKLSGEPGAWAALTLARRGDASVLPRLLKVFRETPSESGRNAALVSRTRVLLSNAARAAKLDLAPLPEGTGPEAYAQVRAWYLGCAKKLKLHDPWLAELKAQKID